MPPKGATSVEMMPSLMPMMPYSKRFGDAPDAAHIAGIEIGGEPEFGVVGHGDGLIVGLEAEQRRDGAEDFLARHLHRRRHVAHDGGLEERARALHAVAAQHDARAFFHRIGDQLLDLHHRRLR